MVYSKHVFHLKDAKPFFTSEHGSITNVTSNELPILKNLCLQRLVLQPGAMREPHWTANCDVLGYCLQGKALISILDNGSLFSTIILEPGQMYHIPSGSLQHVENIGEDEVEMIISYRHEQPKVFSLHASFGMLSDAVIGNTYDWSSAQAHRLKRTTEPKWIIKRPAHRKAFIPDTAFLPNAHKFDLEEITPPTNLPGAGSAKTARAQFWPALKTMAMYSLLIEDKGMREPHWHPETAELGFVNKGEARMSVLDPDGSVDTYLLKPGDCYFIPHAYPHHIECLDPEKIHFLIFFDNPMPEDVGYRAAATALSREVLATTFGIEEDELPEFPRTVKDPLVVKRSNPKDPAA